MWQRFTERARRIILSGQYHATRLNSEAVDSGHLLLGLLSEPEGKATEVLLAMQAPLDAIQQATERSLTVISTKTSKQDEPRLTPTAKRVLELSAEEARVLSHNYIGTEHLLLALLHKEAEVTVDVLLHFGIELEKARDKVEQLCPPSATRLRHTPLYAEVQVQKWQQVLTLRYLPASLTENQPVPEPLQTLAREWAQITYQKHVAVDNDEYELAAELREQANSLEEQFAALANDWQKPRDEEQGGL